MSMLENSWLVDCLHACNQSLLKHDWSIPQTIKWMQPKCFKYQTITCIYLFIEMRRIMNERVKPNLGTQQDVRPTNCFSTCMNPSLTSPAHHQLITSSLTGHILWRCLGTHDYFEERPNWNDQWGGGTQRKLWIFRLCPSLTLTHFCCDSLVMPTNDASCSSLSDHKTPFMKNVCTPCDTMFKCVLYGGRQTCLNSPKLFH